MRRINLKKASVARSDTIRNINRQIVLNYVRERSPISRAEISHETELQRSTVSLIVEELKDQGLIEEIEGESTGGRPPTLLRLRAAGPVALGVDVGTKQTMLAISDIAGRVIDRESFKTDPEADATVEKILECAGRLIKRGRGVEGVGVSVPGLVEPERGHVIFIPHYRWRDWDVAKALKQATGLPVSIDNDANAVALAELWFGRPEIREVRDFVMVLVEEGLGTGLVFDGQVYHGEAGAAGEFGHMTIGAGAPVACAAGNYGCWEAFASERAALARYAKLAPRGEGVETFSRLVDAALGGEAAARAALVETGRYLGVGISNVVKGLSPKSVIVGGEIARAWPLISEELVKAVEENSLCRGMKIARIIPSTLGETPRLMGALSLVLSSKFAAVTTA
ncbi:MAG TPA: ROK family transcriptional regulator [Pyrinomonadaceae bacterium]|nr:ROK family transcriptional regulator [Pyrinomonadaceae bacterium]